MPCALACSAFERSGKMAARRGSGIFVAPKVYTQALMAPHGSLFH